MNNDIDNNFTEKYIPSPDVRTLIKQTCRYFSDSEKATIIYNSHEHLLEIHDELHAIASKTTDTRLKLQIEERLAYNHEAIKLFSAGGDNYYYVLSIIKNDDYKEYQKYKKLGFALNAGKISKREFTVEKFNIETNSTLPVAQFWYDSAARIKYFFSNEYTPTCSNPLNPPNGSRFEYAYVVIPNPYNLGDVVRVIGSDRVGVVATSKHLWRQYVKRALLPGSNYDWWDTGIEICYSKIGSDHEHINPIYLEKTKVIK